MPKQLKKEEKKVVRIPDEFITQAEFYTRKRVWNEYYKKVYETRAYRRFIEQKEALKQGDLASVKRLAQEARQQLISENFLPKPPFSDPETEKRYGRLGIKEGQDIVSQAQTIFDKEANGNE